jgi:hypothetical protein
MAVWDIDPVRCVYHFGEEYYGSPFPPHIAVSRSEWQSAAAALCYSADFHLCLFDIERHTAALRVVAAPLEHPRSVAIDGHHLVVGGTSPILEEKEIARAALFDVRHSPLRPVHSWQWVGETEAEVCGIVGERVLITTPALTRLIDLRAPRDAVAEWAAPQAVSSEMWVATAAITTDLIAIGHSPLTLDVYPTNALTATSFSRLVFPDEHCQRPGVVAHGERLLWDAGIVNFACV